MGFPSFFRFVSFVKDWWPMAKIEIYIEDGANGAVDVRFKFDPPIAEDEPIKNLTAAQMVSGEIMNLFQALGCEPVSKEEK
jgi:hypothetical protein